VFVLTTVTVFTANVLAARVKNQTIAEVEQQGLHIMQILTQTVRNSQKINSPAQGPAAASLSLDGYVSATNPTVFSLANNAITMTEAGGTAVQLTSQRITANQLSFQNLSRTGTRGLIRISFTLNYLNPSGRNEYDFSRNFYTSVNLR
jgi:hypothetical protein